MRDSDRRIITEEEELRIRELLENPSLIGADDFERYFLNFFRHDGKAPFTLLGKAWVAFGLSLGFARHGFLSDGIHCETGTYYDPEGYDSDGYDDYGYHIFGYDINGFYLDGLHKDTGTEYDMNGFDQNGFDKNGYNNTGFDKYGTHKDFSPFWVDDDDILIGGGYNAAEDGIWGVDWGESDDFESNDWEDIWIDPDDN